MLAQEMIVTRKVFRRAVYTALILSVIGLGLVCLPIVGLRYTAEFASSCVRLSRSMGAISTRFSLGSANGRSTIHAWSKQSGQSKAVLGNLLPAPTRSPREAANLNPKRRVAPDSGCHPSTFAEK
jgi:hypothetical protein